MMKMNAHNISKISKRYDILTKIISHPKWQENPYLVEKMIVARKICAYQNILSNYNIQYSIPKHQFDILKLESLRQDVLNRERLFYNTTTPSVQPHFYLYWKLRGDVQKFSPKMNLEHHFWINRIWQLSWLDKQADLKIQSITI